MELRSVGFVQRVVGWLRNLRRRSFSAHALFIEFLPTTIAIRPGAVKQLDKKTIGISTGSAGHRLHRPICHASEARELLSG